MHGDLDVLPFEGRSLDIGRAHNQPLPMETSGPSHEMDSPQGVRRLAPRHLAMSHRPERACFLSTMAFSDCGRSCGGVIRPSGSARPKSRIDLTEGRDASAESSWKRRRASSISPLVSFHRSSVKEIIVVQWILAFLSGQLDDEAPSLSPSRTKAARARSICSQISMMTGALHAKSASFLVEDVTLGLSSPARHFREAVIGKLHQNGVLRCRFRTEMTLSSR